MGDLDGLWAPGFNLGVREHLGSEPTNGRSLSAFQIRDINKLLKEFLYLFMYLEVRVIGRM